MQEKIRVGAVGMAWFEELEYPDVLRVMTDRHVLHQTHAEWLAAASVGYERLKAQGHVVVKAPLHPQEFATWCRQRGLNIDAKARMAWGNEFAKRWLDEQAKGGGS